MRYSQQALADLDDALAYTLQNRPDSVEAVGQRIQRAIAGLAVFPDRGRPGRIAGTRELVISGLPYLAAYRVDGGYVDILTVLHGARLWPSMFEGE